MIVYGAGLSDGNAHTHHDLPTLIAGRGGNFIKTGRRIVYRKETPMCNLFLTMMDRMGHAHGSFRRRDRTSERAGPYLAGRR